MGWTLAAGLAIGYLLICLGMYVYQDNLVYYPDRVLTETPARWNLSFHELNLTGAAGHLHGWWLPPKQSDGAAVLFFHGNGSNISALRSHAVTLHELGLGLLLFDYRGYGLSDGTPSEAGFYADAERFWNHLTHTLALAPEQVILYGHSLGGGVATELALRHPPRALILEATFTSVPDIGAVLYPWLPVRWLSRNHYNNLERIAKLQAPVLILHSPDDEVIGFSHGERLFAAAPEPKRFVTLSGSHDAGLTASAPVGQEALRSFLQTLPGTGSRHHVAP